MKGNDNIEIKWRGSEVVLTGDKAVFFPENRVLALSDIHFGKAAHFRRNGIPVTRGVFEKDLLNLKLVIKKYRPAEVVFIGDLFHSDINKECFEVLDLLRMLPVDFTLVKGNHDIHTNEDILTSSGMAVTNRRLLSENICLVHDPAEADCVSGSVCGHIHPAVRISGRYSSATAPCYVVSPDLIILPAFGSFTGNSIVSPGSYENIFPVSGGKVFSFG